MNTNDKLLNSNARAHHLRSYSVPNKIIGDIAPWSFHQEQNKKPHHIMPTPLEVSSPKQKQTFTSLKHNNNVRKLYLQSPKTIQPKRCEKEKPLKLLTPRPRLSISEQIQQYLSQNNLMETSSPQNKDKLTLPHIQSNKKSSRLLPTNFSPKDQLAIHSIFAQFEQQQQFIEVKLQFEAISRSKPKPRHLFNVKMLYDNGSLSRRSSLPQNMSLRGSHKRLTPKPRP